MKIPFCVSRLSEISDDLLPRLYYSPRKTKDVQYFNVPASMSKHEIIKECDKFTSKIKFDNRAEVNAILFLSSMINGWVYRVMVTKEFPKEDPFNVVDKIILPMICKLISIEKPTVTDDGWTTVNKKKSKIGYNYSKDILEKAHKENWKGIFDLNLQVVIVALAMSDRKTIYIVEKTFHNRIRKRGKNDINKFKMFTFLRTFF